MDAHPVPQNVTSFQFHLVGDMTLKQFGYLATGLGTAYLAFIFLYPVSALLAAPMIVFGILFGVSFAFVPILDRPLDHWVKAYFRAVFSPTKRVWRSPVGGKNQFDLKSPLLLNRLQLYLHPNLTSQLLQPQPTAPNPSPLRPILPLTPQIPPTLKPTPVAPEDNLPTDEALKETVELAKRAQAVQIQIVQAEKELNQLKVAALQPGSDPTSYSKKLQEIFNHLQLLITQAQSLSRQISELNEPQATTAVQPSQPIQPVKPVVIKAPEVKVVEALKAKKTELLLTSAPNVINGIVTDLNGNYLENVVIVIHDHNGLPVRASKTNKLGQFAGATPLPSGEYTLTLEKDNLEFDVLQITLKDEVLSPLHISPKKAGVAK